MLANSSDTVSQENKQRLLLHEARNSISVMMLNLAMLQKDTTTDLQPRLDTIKQELDAVTALLEVIADA